MATTKVTTGGITDATIATADIAADAVTTAKIAAGNVTETELASNAVTGAKIATGAINNANKIQDSIITGAKIGSGTVAAGNIASNAVTTVKIADQAVTLDKLPHGTGSNDGKFLRANNGGDPTFESLPASGATLSGSTNNTVVTVTGSNAMQGEAALTFDGNNFAFSRQDAGDARAYIYGGEGGDARLLLASDEGDDHIDTWEIRAQASDNNLSIYQFGGGSYNKRLSIDTDANNGDVKVHTGNLVIGTSGKGIDFSATANGSGSGSTNELLDDYETGTWSGSINSGSANIGGEWYVKIGKYVHGGGNITAIGDTSSNNVIQVNGLPFTNSGGYSGRGVVTAAKNTQFDKNVDSFVSGTSILFMVSSLSTGSGDYLRHSSVVQSSGSITFSFNYRTA